MIRCNGRSKKVVDNSGKGVTISSDDTKEETDVHKVGKIDRDIYSVISDDIITDETVITDKQIQHIKDRHPQDVDTVLRNIADVLRQPDYIIKDKNPNTGLVIRAINFQNENLHVVLRICTANDPEGYKNSVISCWKISESRLQNYLRNKNVLYKRE